MFIVLKIFSPSSNLSFGDKIGVIEIEGTISRSRNILSEIVKLRKDSGIKAIILRINTPGGSVGATQEIYREIRKTTLTKKVVASLGDVAASGGYYIAAAADKIVANPGSITGSIGIIMHFVRFEELLKKIGINMEIMKSGEFKDIGSPHRELTERDKELINNLMMDIQRQFEESVAKGRNLPVEKVQQIADGRIFTGSQAKELGLVDVLGNFQDAVEIAKNLAGIRGDVKLVFPKKENLRFWDLVLEGAAGSVARLMERMKGRVEYRWDGFVASQLK
jgi:protease-4